jgi:hypothetical protein
MHSRTTRQDPRWSWLSTCSSSCTSTCMNDQQLSGLPGMSQLANTSRPHRHSTEARHLYQWLPQQLDCTPHQKQKQRTAQCIKTTCNTSNPSNNCIPQRVAPACCWPLADYSTEASHHWTISTNTIWAQHNTAQCYMDNYSIISSTTRG